MCKECEELREQNAVLRARVKALRLMVQDLGGIRIEDEEDMYEDEAPLIVYEPEDGE